MGVGAPGGRTFWFFFILANHPARTRSRAKKASSVMPVPRKWICYLETGPGYPVLPVKRKNSSCFDQVVASEGGIEKYDFDPGRQIRTMNLVSRPYLIEHH